MKTDYEESITEFTSRAIELATFGARLFRALVPVPAEAAQHLRNAEREILMTGRSLIDAVLDKLDETEKAGKPTSKEKSPSKKVEVK